MKNIYFVNLKTSFLGLYRTLRTLYNVYSDNISIVEYRIT